MVKAHFTIRQELALKLTARPVHGPGCQEFHSPIHVSFIALKSVTAA